MDRTPRSARIWPWIWCLLAAALVVRTGLRTSGVLTDHLEFGRRVLHGLPLYAPFLEDKPLHPPYPPSFGLLTAPFSLLPATVARFAWGITQALGLLLISLRLRDLAREHYPAILDRFHWVLLFAFALAGRYILRDTHGGGGNLINLAMVVQAFHLARHGRTKASGIVLGFSLATKPTALLVVIPMWILGYRRAAHTAVGFALAFLALALFLLRQGFDPFLAWFEGAVRYAAMDDLFVTPAGGFPPFTWMNQCLRCCVARFLGEVPAQYADLVPGFVDGLGLPTGVTAWISRLLGLGLLTFTAAWVYTGREHPRTRPWALAAALALSLLLSPISWKAHHVALLPAFFLIGALGFTGRWFPFLFGSLYILACGLGEELVGKEFKEVQQSSYLTTFGTLVVLAICLWWIREPEDESARVGR